MAAPHACAPSPATAAAPGGSEVAPQPPKPHPPDIVPPQRPKPTESRWGLWMAIIVLLVGIGGGGIYLATRSSHQNGTVTATLTVDPPNIERGHTVTLRWSAQNATDLDVEPGVGKVQSDGSVMVSPEESTSYTLTATGGDQTVHSTAFVSVSSPAAPPINPGDNTTTQTTREVIPEQTTHERPKPRTTRREGPFTRVSVDPSLVNASITLGDFHLRRGEYDDAISSYQRGLQMDPGNSTLRQKLQGAINACRKENDILNEGLNCGSR